MKMTSMKLPKKREKNSAPHPVGMESAPREEFPYGLRITLERDQLAKLGMKLPAVGSTVKFTAESTVTGVSENKRQGAPDDRSVTLQIERLGIGREAPKSGEEAVEDGIDEANS